MAMNVDADDVMHILRFYHRAVYREVTDYDVAYDTMEEITVDNTTIYKFTLPFQYIYLDETGHAVTYQEQTVEDNKVYYKNPDDEWMEYIAPYEWLKSSSIFPDEYWEEDEEEEVVP